MILNTAEVQGYLIRVAWNVIEVLAALGKSNHFAEHTNEGHNQPTSDLTKNCKHKATKLCSLRKQILLCLGLSEFT